MYFVHSDDVCTACVRKVLKIVEFSAQDFEHTLAADVMLFCKARPCLSFLSLHSNILAVYEMSSGPVLKVWW